MEIVKVGLVVAAALGSTWAARAVTGVPGAPAPAAALVQAAEPGPAPAGGASGAQPPAVPDMSREEMEEELRRAQAEMAGGGREQGLDEFRPSKPLPADLPIALPSDI